METQEIWKDVVGYEGMYQISNLGRIKSLSRKIKCNSSYRIKKETILVNKLTKKGYLSIQLMNKGKSLLIHRLVAQSFISNGFKKPFVNHINGIKTDNNYNNLEWCTRSENQIHAYKLGLQKVSLHKRANGESQGLSKLKEEEVIFIIKNYTKGKGIKLANLFNVSQTTILNIVNKKIWKHVGI